jgi:hypothetical protein
MQPSLNGNEYSLKIDLGHEQNSADFSLIFSEYVAVHAIWGTILVSGLKSE